MDISEGVIVHGFLEVDRIEDFDTVVVALKQLADLADHAAFRVLSIRIEKKVNYFYEVTTSD